MIRLENISKTFGGQELLKSTTLHIHPQNRIGLIAAPQLVQWSERDIKKGAYGDVEGEAARAITVNEDLLVKRREFFRRALISLEV